MMLIYIMKFKYKGVKAGEPNESITSDYTPEQCKL